MNSDGFEGGGKIGQKGKSGGQVAVQGGEPFLSSFEHVFLLGTCLDPYGVVKFGPCLPIPDECIPRSL